MNARRDTCSEPTFRERLEELRRKLALPERRPRDDDEPRVIDESDPEVIRRREEAREFARKHAR